MSIDRRHTFTLTAATALVAGAAALLTAPPSESAGSTEAPAAESTMVFAQRDGTDHFVDVPPLGGAESPPTRGDEYVGTNILLDPGTGERVGRTQTVCVTTQVVHHPLNAFANCNVVLRTGTGQLVLEASWSFSAGAQRLAVTGGTGDYAGARGTAVWKSLRGERSRWEITLQE